MDMMLCIIHKIKLPFPQQVSPATLLDVFVGSCKRSLVDESGMIRKQMGSIEYPKWSPFKVRFLCPPYKDKV
jgi:hypothetical protein